MRRSRTAALGMAVILGACGAREPAPTTRGPVEQGVLISARDDLPLTRVVITREDFVSRAELEGSREEAWDAVPAAFEDVGLPRPATDRATWTARLRDHLVRRRLGERRLSTMLDCGRDIGGAYADTYSIHLDVTVELHEAEGDDEGTLAFTRVEATGQRTDGTGGTVRCDSRGTLEERLMTALQFRLIAPGG